MIENTSMNPRGRGIALTLRLTVRFFHETPRGCSLHSSACQGERRLVSAHSWPAIEGVLLVKNRLISAPSAAMFATATLVSALATTASAPPPPAPPLSGLCADTPAEINGNPRVNSGDYVTWNQSGIAGHDYGDWANMTKDFGGAHNVRPYCNAQSWCIGYTLKNDQSEVWFKTRPPVDCEWRHSGIQLALLLPKQNGRVVHGLQLGGPLTD